MTTAMRRTAVLLAATAALLAGCGAGPTGVRTAAVVGNGAVPIDRVQQRVDKVLLTQQAARDLQQQQKFDVVARGIVSQEVVHQLIGEAARREGIIADEALVDQVATTPSQAQEDPSQSLVNAAFDARELARDQVLLAELAKKYVGRISVTVDAVVLQDLDTAQQLARKVAENPAKSAELMRAASGAQSPPELDQTVSTNTTETMESTGSPIFGVAPNTVLVYTLGQNSTSGGHVVVYVKQRQTVAPPQGADALLSSLDPRQLVPIGTSLLRPLAMELGVRLNSRYGTWDLVSMKVASPAEAAAAGEVLPARSPSA